MVELKVDVIRLVLETSEATHETRMDNPVSFDFGKREFRERFVKTEYVPSEIIPPKEDNDVSVTALS
jgi:hypothetical protein